ncbi:Copper transport protein ATOX1 [Orchesella cincta]|uniref:Copper transport protein ATOX1 n=1 Tax=Orchesella cincta TaxID=48709 RepID=A0A1D2MKD0_ORCCI|nr:Copper transport protein ATOX1 [Orchesella cincta]
MTCEGCSGAVKRLLTRQQEKGVVSDYLIDLPGKTVTVTSALTMNEVQDILAKSGKAVKHLDTKPL